MSRALVWFRNDLRLHDNASLSSALADGRELLLLYCIDPRQFAMLHLGFRKTGLHRARFLLESLSDLQQRCAHLGGQLIIMQGQPEDIIPRLVAEHQIQQVHAQKEVTHEEIQVEEALAAALQTTDCSLHLHHGLTLYHPADMPFAPADMPKAFKAFRHQGTGKAEVRDEYPQPDSLSTIPGIAPTPVSGLPDLGFEQAPEKDSPFTGGETAALHRLQYYLYDTELLTRYKWTRNQSLGMDYSSKFSPWLALGCLSPRRIYHQVRDYEQHIHKNISTYWLIFEMLWRDYFK